MLFLHFVGVFTFLTLNIKEIISVLDKDSVEGFKNIFEVIGFSASCVSKVLSTCEQKSDPYSIFYDHETRISKLENQYENINLEKNYPKNCAEIQKLGDNVTGIKKVFIDKYCFKKSINVFCDQETDGGGWTVLQQRKDVPERENFYRKWIEYKLGFGNLKSEFWLGLDNIHALVSDSLMELRVDLEDYEGHASWAKYEFFYISDENSKYKLSVGDYSGTTGDGLGPHSGMKFTTQDEDNDTWNKNCAEGFKGAWWYTACHSSNLNGLPHKGNHSSYADGINWSSFRGNHYSLKFSKLSVRPRFK